MPADPIPQERTWPAVSLRNVDAAATPAVDSRSLFHFTFASDSFMRPAQHPTALRTQQLLLQAGIAVQVVEFERPTRTSAEAAAAIGCTVDEIAKSIVFHGRTSGRAILVVACGGSRVSESKVARLVGEKLDRANADFVREATGYAIGGVAPLGHATPVKLILDADLQRFPTVWAAAGTPFSVFPLHPAQLVELTGAEWSDIRLEA